MVEEDNKYEDIDERLQNRLDEVRNKARAGRREAPLGRVSTKVAAKAGKMARKKTAEGGNNIFYVLLLVALALDLIEWLDMGTFTTLVNIGAYIIVAVGGFVTWFIKSGGGDKLSIFNLLKGQLWKYLVAPILEWVPIINILPFWTGTALMLWWKFSQAKKKMLSEETNNESAQSAQGGESEIMEGEYA
ncbi:MAG: hypothetical protein V1684_00355 [bacterium]